MHTACRGDSWYVAYGAKYCDQCVSVCLPIGLHISKTTPANLTEFSVHVTCEAVARFSSDDSAVRYVLPVL